MNSKPELDRFSYLEPPHDRRSLTRVLVGNEIFT